MTSATIDSNVSELEAFNVKNAPEVLAANRKLAEILERRDAVTRDIAAADLEIAALEKGSVKVAVDDGDVGGPEYTRLRKKLAEKSKEVDVAKTRLDVLNRALEEARKNLVTAMAAARTAATRSAENLLREAQADHLAAIEALGAIEQRSFGIAEALKRALGVNELNGSIKGLILPRVGFRTENDGFYLDERGLKQFRKLASR